MKSVHCLALAAVLATLLVSCAAQRRPPNYSLDDMPETSFDCRDKTIGGYYADPEADCQMFHVCVKMSDTDIQDFRFLCPNDTMFDQENQICANWFDIDCEANSLYYSKGFDLLRVGNGPANDDLLQRSPEPEKRLPTVITTRQKQQREEQELFRASSSSDIHRGRDEEDEEFERQNKKKAKVSVRRKQQNSRGRRPVVTTTQRVDESTTALPETNRPSVPDYTTINRNNNRNDQRGSTSTPNDFIRNTQRTAASVPTNNFQQKTSPPPPTSQKNNFQINVQSTTPQRNTFQTPAPNSGNQNSSPKNDFQNSSPQPRGDFRRNQNRNNLQTSPPAQIPNNHFDVPRTNPRNNNGQQQPQQRNNNVQQQQNQQRNNNGQQQPQQRNNNVQQQEQQRNNNGQQQQQQQRNNNAQQQEQQRNNNGGQQQQQQRNNNGFQQQQNNNFQQRTNQQQNNFLNQGARNQQRNQPPEPANFVTPPPPTPFNVQRSSFEATTAQPSTFHQQSFPSSTLSPPFRSDRNQGFISSTVAPPQHPSTFAPITNRQTFTNEINPSTISPTTYNAFQQRKNAAADARRNFQSTPIPNNNFNNNFNNNNNQQRNFQSTAAPFQQSPSSVSQSFPPIITTPKPQFFPTTYTPQTYKNRPQENVPKPFQQRRTSRPRDDFNNNEHPDELLNTAQSAGIRASDLNAIQRTSVNYQSSTPFPAPSSPRSFTAPRQQTNRPRGPPQPTIPPAAQFDRSRNQPQPTPAPFEKIRTPQQQQQQFDNRRVNSNQPQNFNTQSTPFFNPSTVSPNLNTNAAKTNSFLNNPSTTVNFNSNPSKQAFNFQSTQTPIRQSSQNNFFNPSTAQNINTPTQNAFNSPSTVKPFFNSSPVQPQRPSTQNNFNPSTPQPFQQKSTVTQSQTTTQDNNKPNKKPHKKANSDYDYAYYDETPYDEYDGVEHIDEFHKTNSKHNING